MRSALPRRKTANVSDSLHSRLNSYALAAGAAGVGVLALNQSAEARIVYRTAHHRIGNNQHYPLDLNHDGIPDVIVLNKFFRRFDFSYASLNANTVSGNGVEGAHYASVVQCGSKIGSKQPFSGQLMISYRLGAGTGGKWRNVRNGYLGVKFVIKGKVHYGWARFNVHHDFAEIYALLTGYAYETIPNKPIIAGKTHGPDVITMVEPASLGRLAQGSVGLAAWRRKESASGAY